MDPSRSRPRRVGTFMWIASYSGDAENNPVAGKCGDDGETDTTIKDSPTISTVASANITIGGSISDTATLAGGFNPTGTITFQLYGPNDATCTNRPIFTTTKAVNGNGSYTSAAFTPTLVGHLPLGRQLRRRRQQQRGLRRLQ